MRTVVVTGGKRGIGASIAWHFEGLGDRVIPLSSAELDVTDEQAVTEVFGGIGPVDVLVNNAGVSSSAPLKRTTLEEWERQIAVNATGAFLCTRAVAGGMRARGSGAIVTVASIAGRVGARYTAAYTASKHAAVGLMRATAAELAGSGATANAVCPAFVDTPMTDRAVTRIEELTGRGGARRSLEEMTPLGRLLEPDEVAGAVAWLASPAAAAVNGQTLVLDGGGIQA